MPHEIDQETAVAIALTTALVGGIEERPRWTGFLDLLRDSTGADHSVLAFHPPGRPFRDGIRLTSSDVDAEQLDASHLQHFPDADRTSADTSADGVPVSLDDFLRTLPPTDHAATKSYLEKHGISAFRRMRISEKGGVDAVLSISRRGPDFTQRDEDLLVAIAPVLRSVFQIYMGHERDRYASSLTAEAVKRLQFGWIALDATGFVLDCDVLGEQVLTRSGVIGKSVSGQLVAQTPALSRQIATALQGIARNPLSRPRAMILCQEPWLDMLLVANRRKTLTAKPQAVAIAYVHSDSWLTSDRHEQLAELFGLSPREARLALALSRGMTIAEAAVHHGWTENTARTYSRSIYAKTGARGQPDLVRIVMRSVLAAVRDP